MAAMTPDDLRPLALFEGLSDAHLRWFCEHGVPVAVAAHMSDAGDDQTPRPTCRPRQPG